MAGAIGRPAARHGTRHPDAAVAAVVGPVAVGVEVFVASDAGRQILRRVVSEIPLRALGSVQMPSPVVSGVLMTAGVQALCASSWKETVPLVKARRPTRAGGSPCAMAVDHITAAPTMPVAIVTTPRRKS
jgi:hypothetical protein